MYLDLFYINYFFFLLKNLIFVLLPMVVFYINNERLESYKQLVFLLKSLVIHILNTLLALKIITATQLKCAYKPVKKKGVSPKCVVEIMLL